MNRPPAQYTVVHYYTFEGKATKGRLGNYHTIADCKEAIADCKRQITKGDPILGRFKSTDNRWIIFKATWEAVGHDTLNQ